MTCQGMDFRMGRPVADWLRFRVTKGTFCRVLHTPVFEVIDFRMPSATLSLYGTMIRKKVGCMSQTRGDRPVIAAEKLRWEKSG